MEREGRGICWSRLESILSPEDRGLEDRGGAGTVCEQKGRRRGGAVTRKVLDTAEGFESAVLYRIPEVPLKKFLLMPNI